MGAVGINRLLRILTNPAFALGAFALGARAGHRAGHAHGAHETRYDAWPFREQPLGEGVECEVGERPGRLKPDGGLRAHEQLEQHGQRARAAHQQRRVLRVGGDGGESPSRFLLRLARDGAGMTEHGTHRAGEADGKRRRVGLSAQQAEQPGGDAGCSARRDLTRHGTDE